MTWTDTGLTTVELKMLELEKGTYRNFGSKHQQVEAVLHMGPTEYYRRLGELIEKPAALRREPLLVKRLLRLRDKRRAARSRGFDAVQ